MLVAGAGATQGIQLPLGGLGGTDRLCQPHGVFAIDLGGGGLAVAAHRQLTLHRLSGGVGDDGARLRRSGCAGGEHLPAELTVGLHVGGELPLQGLHLGCPWRGGSTRQAEVPALVLHQGRSILLALHPRGHHQLPEVLSELNRHQILLG